MFNNPRSSILPLNAPDPKFDLARSPMIKNTFKYILHTHSLYLSGLTGINRG